MATAPIILHLSDNEFLARYGNESTSLFRPLFSNERLSIYLDASVNVIYMVTPS